MNAGELFTRAVEMLPDPVRERLDGDAPLDWAVLGDARLGADLDQAASTHHRLPEPVEALVHRLIRDIGIVPADVATGVDRQGTAIGWVHWVTVESDGGSYQIRNDRSGEVHTGVRPEAIAGYATLGLELAAAVHDACERWIEVGERQGETPEEERSNLSQCAARMHAQLRVQPETISGRPSAASLARTLEYAWNTQDASLRAALAGIRLSTARGARAPRRCYYAPATSHHLHACDVGEMRWFRALAERAATAERSGARAHAGPGGRPAGDAREDLAHPAFLPAANAVVAEDSGTLVLGSEPEALTAEAETAELERAANHLPGAVRRRLGETYGAAVAQALARFQSRPEVDAVRGAADSADGLPRWLLELASVILRDAGAQTRHGARTGSVRLDRDAGRDGRHRGTDVESREHGRLSPVALIEQIRLSLTFANGACSGFTALQSAGKEGRWTLDEAESGGRELVAAERETLEAAQEIGHALDRIHREHAGVHGERAPTALEESAMTAEALRMVGPTIRTAAGWPGSRETPDPRNPEDVARIAAVGEALHAQIRMIANRLIAGWIAEVQAFGEGRRQ